MYNTVIFDLDGTLLNTLEDLCDSVNYALRLNDMPERTIGEVRRFVGNGIVKLMERAVPAGTDEELGKKVFLDFKTYYGEHCNDKTAPYDGIMELIRELKMKGFKLAIASNKVKSAVQTLNEIYFDGMIEYAAGAVDGKPVKPDSYMIDVLLEELGCDKKDVLYVGDSEVDVMTAKNAGLDMVTVLWGFRDKEELIKAGATRFASHPREIAKFLENVQ